MHSIRYKALLPMALLALVLVMLIVTAAFALSESIGLSRNLASRYHEIEQVRQIEVRFGKLTGPLIRHLDSGSTEGQATVNRALSEIAARVRQLREMAVVNAEEREVLEFVDEKLSAVQRLSDDYFKTNRSEHVKLMRTLAEITLAHLDQLSDRLHRYHDDEIRQVDALVRDAERVQSGFRVAGFAAVGIMLALLALAIWVNNSVLVRPILTISRSTADIADGRLDQLVGVTSNDELGQLARDISEMAKSLQATHQRMEQLANTDALTGLMNRRAFEQAIKRELDETRRYGRTLGLVMVDVDHFKQVNDVHGHAIGDEVLKFVAQSCTQTLRSSDAAFRIGGEEFVLLLQEVDRKAVVAAAERVRWLIAEHPWTNGVHTVSVTASFGVACAPRNGDSPDAMMKAADSALYEAKANGRNRVASAPCGGDVTPQQTNQPCLAP